MKSAVPSLAPVLRSDTQGRILAAVLLDPDAEHSVTELARRATTSVPTAIREVDRAERAGVVTSRRVGPTRLVHADTANPLTRPLTEIILATYGPPAVVAEELSAISSLSEAYLFGSWAARYLGEPGPGPADIDVLVIGTPRREEIYDAAQRAEDRLGLPVQTTIRTPAQWENTEDPFVVEVRSRPLVPLIVEGAEPRR